MDKEKDIGGIKMKLYEKKIKEILKDIEEIGKKNKTSDNSSVHYTKLIAEMELKKWAISIVREIDKQYNKLKQEVQDHIRYTTRDDNQASIETGWSCVRDNAEEILRNQYVRMFIMERFELKESDIHEN